MIYKTHVFGKIEIVLKESTNGPILAFEPVKSRCSKLNVIDLKQKYLPPLFLKILFFQIGVFSIISLSQWQ